MRLGSLPTLATAPQQRFSVPIAFALRRVLARGYGATDLKADVMAGLVVGVVALPLSMALSIAIGAPPQHGLYTAIVAGIATSLLGGCKFQVTGPTAAFVVILAPIVHKYGLSGLMTAGLLAGVILIALGVARLGNLIRFIPYPVTSGFTTGIGVVIATLQIKDVFGLDTGGPLPDRYVEKLAALWGARASAHLGDFAIAVVTLALLLIVPRVLKKVPAPLIAITVVTVLASVLHQNVPIKFTTIGDRFHDAIALPRPALPSFAMVGELVGPAFAIAMLGAIESLLSAVIADGMTNTKHDPNAELVGLGIGNVLAPIFGGIAATGALARTATNVRAGARSPLAATTHSIFLVLSILLLGPLVAYVPMASLAALLLLVAWNMAEVRHFIQLIRVSPKSDVFVLSTCFLLTVFFDMVVAVAVGFMLAAVLFMRRMSEMVESRVVLDASEEASAAGSSASVQPEGVIVYEINGPLFFGATQKAMAMLSSTLRDGSFRVLVLHLGRVPVIDATGFVALQSAISSVKTPVVLAGPLPEPKSVFDKARLEEKHPHLRITSSLSAALAVAREIVVHQPPAQ